MTERNVTLYVKLRLKGGTTPEAARGKMEDLLFDDADQPWIMDEVGVASYVLPQHAAEVTTEQAWRYAARGRTLEDTEEP